MEKEIHKNNKIPPNLKDYAETCKKFRWEDVKKELGLDTKGGVNIATNAIDAHADTWRRNKVALYWEGSGEERKKYTFGEMRQESNRVGNMLKSLGVNKGDRVFVFLPRIPELYISIIGIAKIGAVAGPMFSAFGPEAIRDRLKDSGAKVLITDASLRERVHQVWDELPELKTVVVTRLPETERLWKAEIHYEREIEKASYDLGVEQISLEDPLYMLYTSGTTGKPKGVVHVQNDMISHYITTKWALDLHEEDVYWCSADPGWVTGTVYGLWGPWLNGASQVVFEGRYDAERWYSVMEQYGVTVWYTAPTALRMLMKAGEEPVKRHDLSALRYICSVGEPLNPEVIRWGMDVYGLCIHDTWWQTETGSILITNYPSMPIRPGSMGKPFPGVEAAIIDAQGKELPPGSSGILAIRPGWPSMMRTLWKDEKRYKEYFQIPGWYTTGDTAHMDKDGYFWFIGRADDVIMTAGHRVGPFEVESALVEHKAVAEAGVIGKPDPERGQIIKAFLVLREGFSPSDELKDDIKEFIKHRLSAHAYPREIQFCESVPKTRSGKIMRRLLKARELGLPEGDLSTLEE
ncbi:MAG: acetate--CoA ligase [Planctomycetes bacterium RIFCSPLOWO2_12_FULL_50_35]|nr:MAG: acetate--CoA ligase [Planctomycetes bacterium RIFCSPHIGHO2_12_FULL_51_37]OHB95692.1 MAG: acetate--CoA ligase [Planctomycetes bacterium RIFCSPLOWO2_02_FULL_50_16]OHC05288.1 MAG: acetate--CoA ligase [Planctomycetes bacterium RIFCSPLOWO2_12_FULL_50_35]